MPNFVTLKALGLNTSPNALNQSDGAMSEASNVIIKRDNIVESRRGFNLYGTSFGSISDVAKQVMTYQKTLLLHYDNKLLFDSDGMGTWVAFAGDYLEPVPGIRIKYLESNGNFYFTTSNGIYKISQNLMNPTSLLNDETNYVTPAGGIKALDLELTLVPTVGQQNGFLQQDAVVGYEVVWGTVDANGNLILGVPSQEAIIYNTLQGLTLLDYNNLLAQLDNIGFSGSLIDNQNYLSTFILPYNASASQIQTNLIDLAAAIDENIVYADDTGSRPLTIPLYNNAAYLNLNNLYITFSAGNVTDYLSNPDIPLGSNFIEINGFSSQTGVLPSTGAVNNIKYDTSVISSITSNTINTSTPHGFVVNDPLTFVNTGGSLPSGISANTVYYVISTNFTPNSYSISTTIGSQTPAAISGGSGTNTAITDYLSIYVGSGTSVIVNTISSASTPINTTTGVVTTPSAHELVVGDLITWTTSNTLPTGIAANTNYYVTTIGSSNTFQFSSSANGAPIIPSDQGVGTQTISTVPTGLGPGGTITLNNPSINSYNYENITAPTVPNTPPTDNDLLSLQTFLTNLFVQLQKEPTTVIPADAAAAYIDTLIVTTTANVDVTFTVPVGVTVNDFFQIYRTQQTLATGTTVLNTLSPGAEFQLAYEAYPTQAQIDAGTITVLDDTPDSFLGADLYTNPVSGDGTLQANEVPPLATDLAKYNGYTFYANTETRQRFSLSLLGVENMLAEYNGGTIPTLTIASANGASDYSFIAGVAQESTINIGPDISSSLDGTYFTFYSANNAQEYYVWYFVTSGVDPMIPGAIGIEVQIGANDNAAVVATKTFDAVAQYFRDFTVVQNIVSFYPFSVNTGTSTITLTVAPGVQPYNLNDRVYISNVGGSLPTGISATTLYYIVNPTNTTIQLSTTPSGSPISITGQGTGINTITAADLYVTNTAVGYTTDFNPGTTGFTHTSILGQGQRVTQQVQTLTVPAGSTFVTSGTANYFPLYGVYNQPYYVWFKSGGSTDPALVGYTGIEVIINSGMTSTQVAQAIVTAITNDESSIFTATNSTNTVTISNIDFGPALPIVLTNLPAGSSTILVIPGALDVLLSTNVSPGLAIAETAQSLVSVINQNQQEQVFAYYLSGVNQVPGSILIEARQLDVPVFYLLGNNSVTGSSFHPDLSPTLTITNVATGLPAVITTSVPHNLNNGDSVIISSNTVTADSTIPDINGLWPITYVSPTQFSIPVDVLHVGTESFMAINALYAQYSSNSTTPNRLFYSKFQQPEAVPLLNYLDIGDTGKPILRIIPLRSSLFIFKEEGLYRLNGTVAPFTLALFDTSVKMIAPDSAGITSNIIYSWCTQGIVPVSEAGASPVISRVIDDEILKLASASYTNFDTATWGVGYDSDHAYYVATVTQTTDVRATIIYRYSTQTNTWTTFSKTNTCGIVNINDDKLYMGAGDIDYLEQERKNFDRSDYADRQVDGEILTNGNYFNNGLNLGLTSTKNVNVGDVVYQLQYITPYNFNSLLQTLDLDTNVSKVLISSISTGSTVTVTTATNHTLANNDVAFISGTNSLPIIDGTYTITYISPTQFAVTPQYPVEAAGTAAGYVKYSYYNNLEAVGGDDMRSDLVNVATRLDADPTLHGGYSNLIQQLNLVAITSNSVADPTIITSPSNGLVNGRIIQISNNVGSVPSINNQYQVTVIDSNHFSVPVDVTLGGTGGTFNTENENFQDIQACYNAIVLHLNADAGTTNKNYQQVTSSQEVESVITEINPVNNQITLNYPTAYIQGALTIFNSIDCEFEYLPITFGDPTTLKHLSETTVIFTNQDFSTATLSFASDLLPALIQVPFSGQGSGIFGTPNFGTNFFGGQGNSQPFRTYVPRNVQRCRYLTLQFNHQIARETWSIYGMTVTGNSTQSSRGYR
jgi:hypothetical protein